MSGTLGQLDVNGFEIEVVKTIREDSIRSIVRKPMHNYYGDLSSTSTIQFGISINGGSGRLLNSSEQEIERLEEVKQRTTLFDDVVK